MMRRWVLPTTIVVGLALGGCSAADLRAGGPHSAPLTASTGGSASGSTAGAVADPASPSSTGGSVATAGTATSPTPGGTGPSLPTSAVTSGGTAPSTSTTGTSTPGTSTPGTGPNKPSKPASPPKLRVGSSGDQVRAAQERLRSLGYWVGRPDGTFGLTTQQAVFALQKAAGIGRDGIIGPKTRRALDAGIRPRPTITSGIEIDKARQLLLVVRGGQLVWTFNTSTGSGQPYTSSAGTPAIATTPSGAFRVYRSVNGLDKGKLGTLYRPRYFHEGIAVHGLGFAVPPYPASHGCARVSDPAMDFIWANNLMPMGSTVVVR